MPSTKLKFHKHDKYVMKSLKCPSIGTAIDAYGCAPFSHGDKQSRPQWLHNYDTRIHFRSMFDFI